MREQALRIGRTGPTDRERRNLLREYLQHVLLRCLFEERLLGGLVFYGGTALRMLHDLARFSGGLDFHTWAGVGAAGGGEAPRGAGTAGGREGSAGAGVAGEGEGVGSPGEAAHLAERRFDLRDHLNGLVARIESGGYRLDTRPRLQGNVQSCMFRFPELLHACDLSPRPEEKLSIKLEIDRNPPAGFAIERSPVDRYFPLVVVHHDRPTFLAGKLHALLQRPFAKGRDYYDLMFYLRRWPEVAPNLEYLEAALRQTGYEGQAVTEASWKDLVAERVRRVDWAAVARDIAPFILRAGDLDAFEKEFLLRLL